MPRRSVLFVPGDRPDRLRDAPESGADVVVFDLEDAVTPDRKGLAREAVNDTLHSIDPDCELCVRLNPAGIAADDDLGAVLAGTPRLDSVVLPKVADEEDVETLARLLAEHDADLPVLAVVESAAGVLHAEAIAAASPTDALLFDAADFAADVGATRTDAGTELLYARQRVVTAASATGVDAIETLSADAKDTDGVRRDTRRAVEMGYDGKVADHPRQVAVVNEAFTPSEAELAWAERVLDARDRADTGDREVFSVDGESIDAPLVARAERIVARAVAAGARRERDPRR